MSTGGAYVRREGLHAAEMDGELVMLDLEEGNYLGLNAVGAYIWQLLETPQTIDAVTERIVAVFSVDEDTGHSDVVEFLRTLSEHKLVTLSS